MTDLAKTQWELVADAVSAVGGKANRTEVWEHLKKSHPYIPFSTVSAELNAVSVNAPARTSYHAGKQPRLTDSGNRYDRLFKVGVGNGAYYEVYDPKVHGVWEIYQDPLATSTNKTSIRRTGGGADSITVTLIGGELKPGNSYFPIKTFDGRFFPESMIRSKDPDAPATPARFTTDAGTEFESDIYRNSSNSGYLYNRSAARAYYAARPAQPGDRLRFEKQAEGQYHITYLPAASGAEAMKGKVEMESVQEHDRMVVNRILFGPPGTGKTYRTVDEALRILDPEFLSENEGDRAALKARFNALSQSGHIRFVTFHQSFSYEDFVEGIRASTDESTGALRYEVEDGVFKQICEAARSRAVQETGSGVDIAGRRIWKLSLGDSNTEQYIFDECMDKGVALMGFGAEADLSGVATRADIFERIKAAGAEVKSDDYAVTALDQFVRRMKTGDLVVVSQGNLKFRAIGEVTGGYMHLDRDGADTYSQARPVRWLRQYEPARPYTELMESRFSQMTIYEPSTINKERLAALLAPEQPTERGPEPRVLIIDEINRGNVSRVFGELITLIEPSKREGAAEALEVTLPYSKDRFSVPANVHLIGTMNTADRSLAGLDVALRRRFEFVEMLPDVEALEGVVVAGIPIDALLFTMNRRIEALLGRDYMLGHAYFMGLDAASPLQALAGVFRRQVLPLLQEYFFEDWQKIAWVLNDHRKPAGLQFLRQANGGMAELLGEGIELPSEGRLWTINGSAFDKPEAYLAIIEAPKASA
jgi:5-methylcytosine-specific restriction protein B